MADRGLYMYDPWSAMDALSTHLEVRMLGSRISKLTPDYWRRSGDNQHYGRLYYVKEGRGSLRSHGSEHTLQPDRLYLVPPRGDLTYACSENMQIWWMHFTATLFGCVDLFDYLPYRI